MTLLNEAIRECQSVIGHDFADVGFLKRSLIHASAATTRVESNERLEFLGDAVFGAIICDELYRLHPEKTEGDLTRIKSAVVSRTACARVTKALGLGKYIVLGKGVASKSGKIPGSILAAVMEAIIAAIYLDAGYEAARQFVVTAFARELVDAADGTTTENHKSQLQQEAQRVFSTTPSYKVVAERGPDHLKSFQVSATVDGREFSAAWGPNKKEAEQRAAENALCEMSGKSAPHVIGESSIPSGCPPEPTGLG